MITLTKLNGGKILFNCELIETAEETPDTVITTIEGKKWVVKETIEEIVDKVVRYKGKIQLISRINEKID